METLRTLFWADQISIKRWFASGRLSKIVVSLLFFLVFAGVAAILFGIGNIFFRSMATFAEFGQMTAGYIIHAAIVIIMWLALGSSVAASAGMLLLPNPSLSLLLSLPVPRGKIAVYLFLKTVVANLTLMLFAFFPIMLSYAGAFHVLSAEFMVRAILVLSCIVLISSGIGIAIALSLVTWLRGREYPMAIVGLAFFFAVMVGLLRLVFPPSLAQLYDATNAQFTQLFSALPLNHPMLPTAWLTTTVTSGFGFDTLLAIVATATIVLFSLAIQIDNLVQVILTVRSQPFVNNISAFWEHWLIKARHPLLVKDWLSITRLPSEIGYGLFLFSIAVFFFLFLSFGAGGELRQFVWQTQLTVFSFGWLMFFTVAFLLRFIFPLMAREGKSAWYLFGLPLPRMKILFSKVLLALLLSIPLLVFALLVWWMLPFAAGYRRILVVLSAIVICLLSIGQTFLGSISPNFSLGHDPEKVSTSGMGLLTLGVSAAVTVAAGLVVQRVMTGQITRLAAAALTLFSAVVIDGILWIVARESARRYEW